MDLEQAVVSGGPDAIERALAAGADPNTPLTFGEQPVLAYAVEHFYSDPQLLRVNLLLRHGADPNAASPDGRTAVHIAADLGSEPLLRLLARYGADFERQIHDPGYTPFHCAIAGRFPREPLLHTLIELGASPHARRRDGGTALHTMVRFDAYHVLDVLIAAGVDPTVLDEHGLLANDHAGGFSVLATRPLARYLESFRAARTQETLRASLEGADPEREPPGEDPPGL